MSRPFRTLASWRAGFPRVSGDEPFDGNFFGVEEEFSPRERG